MRTKLVFQKSSAKLFSQSLGSYHIISPVPLPIITEYTQFPALGSARNSSLPIHSHHKERLVYLCTFSLLFSKLIEFTTHYQLTSDWPFLVKHKLSLANLVQRLQHWSQKLEIWGSNTSWQVHFNQENHKFHQDMHVLWFHQDIDREAIL